MGVGGPLGGLRSPAREEQAAAMAEEAEKQGRGRRRVRAAQRRRRWGWRTARRSWDGRDEGGAEDAGTRAATLG